jgi:hypothetical protein
VFNGSVRVVTGVSLEDSERRVLLDEDADVAYGFEEVDELTHAYAVSIYRAQGSPGRSSRSRRRHREAVDRPRRTQPRLVFLLKHYAAMIGIPSASTRR